MIQITHSTPRTEFLDILRDMAIAQRQSAQFIDAIDALHAIPTEDEIQEAKAAAHDAGYDEGLAAGREEIAREYKQKLQGERQVAYDEGFADGQAAAPNASDVERVNALLSTVCAAVEQLRPLQEPGSNSLKTIAAARKLARTVAAALNRAVITYKGVRK